MLAGRVDIYSIEVLHLRMWMVQNFTLYSMIVRLDFMSWQEIYEKGGMRENLNKRIKFEPCDLYANRGRGGGGVYIFLRTVL